MYMYKHIYIYMYMICTYIYIHVYVGRYAVPYINKYCKKFPNYLQNNNNTTKTYL